MGKQIWAFLALFLVGGIVPAVASDDPAQSALDDYKAAMNSLLLDPKPAPAPLTPSAKAAAQQAVLGILKDPGSAIWGDARAFSRPSGLDVCGDVNAKNSMGGYAGAEPFHVALSKAANGWSGSSADIAAPGYEGPFYEFNKVCYPKNW